MRGYEVGIYASLSWWNTRLTSGVFNNPTWHKWIAQWNTTCSYNGEYTMWQYTSSGSVDGIDGNVDMDIWYGKDTYLTGDINGDGTVDSSDAGMILRYDINTISLSAEQLKAGDVNGDGAVDSGDAGMILRYDAGIIDSLN